MNADTRIPGSLKVVAALFILGGVSAAIEVVVSLMNNRISINLGVLGIFIGPGLLRLSRGWRTCALVFLWIALIAIPIFTILMIGHSGPLDFKILGQKVGYAPKELGILMAVLLFLLALWQYPVLTSQRVRRLFGLESV
jgi:hypothetical protein